MPDGIIDGTLGNKHTAGLGGGPDPDGCTDGGETMRKVQAERDKDSQRQRLREALAAHPDDVAQVLLHWVRPTSRCVHIDQWIAHNGGTNTVQILEALHAIAGSETTPGRKFILRRANDGVFSVRLDRPVVKVSIPELQPVNSIDDPDDPGDQDSA